MKTRIISSLTVLSCFLVNQVQAQTKVSEPYLAYYSSGESEVIRLKNLSNKAVTIFAGPKEELSSPKPRQKTYNPNSTNTIYVSMNEVVCIIGADEKPVSCEDVKTGIVEMEINAGGAKIVAKK